MPCLSYDTEWVNKSSRKHDIEIKVLKEEADKLARIACQALAELEKVAPDSGLLSFPSELTRWWDSHKKADAARKAAEQKEKTKNAELARKRKAALAKLTAEERSAFKLRK
jgi:hypothetical protein